jgi:serine/threonine protein kinase
MFLNEAMILGIANHDNITKLHSKYLEKDHFNMVMEYCNAGDLSQLI